MVAMTITIVCGIAVVAFAVSVFVRDLRGAPYHGHFPSSRARTRSRRR